MNIQRRGTKMLGAIALGVLPLTLSSPAFADSHTASLTVGPVPVLGAPLSACIDDVCTPTQPLTDVTLTAVVTSDSAIDPVVLTPALCPVGEVGVAIRVSSLSLSESVSVSAEISGTTTDGDTFSLALEPEEKSVGVGLPGVVVSACTD